MQILLLLGWLYAVVVASASAFQASSSRSRHALSQQSLKKDQDALKMSPTDVDDFKLLSQMISEAQDRPAKPISSTSYEDEAATTPSLETYLGHLSSPASEEQTKTTASSSTTKAGKVSFPKSSRSETVALKARSVHMENEAEQTKYQSSVATLERADDDNESSNDNKDPYDWLVDNMNKDTTAFPVAFLKRERGGGRFLVDVDDAFERIANHESELSPSKNIMTEHTLGSLVDVQEAHERIAANGAMEEDGIEKESSKSSTFSWIDNRSEIQPDYPPGSWMNMWQKSKEQHPGDNNIYVLQDDELQLQDYLPLVKSPLPPLYEDYMKRRSRPFAPTPVESRQRDHQRGPIFKDWSLDRNNDTPFSYEDNFKGPQFPRVVLEQTDDKEELKGNGMEPKEINNSDYPVKEDLETDSTIEMKLQNVKDVLRKIQSDSTKLSSVPRPLPLVAKETKSAASVEQPESAGVEAAASPAEATNEITTIFPRVASPGMVDAVHKSTATKSKVLGEARMPKSIDESNTHSDTSDCPITDQQVSNAASNNERIVPEIDAPPRLSDMIKMKEIRELKKDTISTSLNDVKTRGLFASYKQTPSSPGSHDIEIEPSKADSSNSNANSSPLQAGNDAFAPSATEMTHLEETEEDSVISEIINDESTRQIQPPSADSTPSRAAPPRVSEHIDDAISIQGHVGEQQASEILRAPTEANSETMQQSTRSETAPTFEDYMKTRDCDDPASRVEKESGAPAQSNSPLNFYEEYMKKRKIPSLAEQQWVTALASKSVSAKAALDERMSALQSDSASAKAVLDERMSALQNDSAFAKTALDKRMSVLQNESVKYLSWLQEENERIKKAAKVVTGDIADAIDDMTKELSSEYEASLKKKVRLALTGGVPVDREIEGERPVPDLDTRSMTYRIMNSMKKSSVTDNDGASTWEEFLQAEYNWRNLREYMPVATEVPTAPFVAETKDDGNPTSSAKLEHQKDKSLDYDVAICGGKLGIFYATALQLKGHKVCVLDTGKLRGTEQEWNIGMGELEKLKEIGVLTQDDIDAAVQTEYPGCRTAFKNKEVEVEGGYADNGIGYEFFTEGVLNVGVSPRILIERVARRFVSLGGVIREDSKLEGISVRRDIGAALDLGHGREPLTAHLIIDAMGSNSKVTLQQRNGRKPDGICAVIGSCASGFDPKTNTIGDFCYTNSAIQNKKKNGKMQYFWQSFPVGIGRNGKAPGTSDKKTTFMFTYLDADERRPTLEALMEDYWKLLPQYQPSIKNPETDLDVKRVLFAYLPTYKDSPLQPGFDRILAVGDAAGDGALSFGGLGSLTRQLGRVTDALSEALEGDLLSKEDLRQINPYTPNQKASWMFKKSMSVGMNQMFVDRRFINRLLATNAEAANSLGPRTITPLLQGVVRFDGLVNTLSKSFKADPLFMPQIVSWVGLPSLIDWVGHVSTMGVYSALDNYVTPWLKPVSDSAIRKNAIRTKYYINRKMEEWHFGSGNDYDVTKLPPSPEK